MVSVGCVHETVTLVALACVTLRLVGGLGAVEHNSYDVSNNKIAVLIEILLLGVILVKQNTIIIPITLLFFIHYHFLSFDRAVMVLISSCIPL